MNKNETIDGFLFVTIAVFVILAIVYIYAFVWVVKEGYKRDILNIGLIGVALLGTPFMAVAFVKSTKQDSDRLKITYKDKNGIEISSTLSKFIKQKLVATIIRTNDINNYCRFCNTNFIGKEISCNNCKKKRIWYKVIIYNNTQKRKRLINISELQKLDNYSEIKGIKRFYNRIKL